MGKQSIYVKHKDEIFEKLLSVYRSGGFGKGRVLEYQQRGYIMGLEWVLGLDKTQKEKDQEFSDKIDELTSKGESNEHQD